MSNKEDVNKTDISMYTGEYEINNRQMYVKQHLYLTMLMK